MIDEKQLDAAYAGFVEFMGGIRLPEDRVNDMQQAWIAGFAAGITNATTTVVRKTDAMWAIQAPSLKINATGDTVVPGTKSPATKLYIAYDPQQASIYPQSILVVYGEDKKDDQP